jgi:hypothetical protein
VTPRIIALAVLVLIGAFCSVCVWVLLCQWVETKAVNRWPRHERWIRLAGFLAATCTPVACLYWFFLGVK